MSIADYSLLGHFANSLNLNIDSGRSSLANKSLPSVLFLSASGLKLPLAD
jgi:hypothetical protein